MRRHESTRLLVSATIHAALLLAVTLYFLSYLTSAPNSAEGAVMVDYVDRTATGERVFFDFFDYYGPVSWWVPARFYVLAGHKEIGIRVYLVAVKLVTVVISYALVRRASDTFHALLGALLVAALVGQPWTFFQIPYAPHLTLPLVLGSWLLVLPPLARHGLLRILAAALTTAVTLWTKVSVGAFVLGGVAFYLLYWLPAANGDARAGAQERKLESAFRTAEIAGLASVVIVFHAFMWKHRSVFLFCTLSPPILVVCGWTAHDVLSRWKRHEPFAFRLRAAGVYCGATVALWAAFLVAYFGRSSAQYLDEQIRTFGRLRLEMPFSTLGMRGQHEAFNRWFWPELPLLVTAVGVAWIVLGRRHTGTPDSRAPTRTEDATVAGLWAMFGIHDFVIYPRPDDSHLVQALLPAAPVLVVFLFHLGARIPASPRARFWRKGVAAAVVLYSSTILAVPSRSAFAVTFGDWKSPRLRYLTYHSHGTSDLGDGVFAGKSYAEWDKNLDQAAQLIDSLTEDGEEVLVLGRAQILNYASNTRPFGGRHSHFFHLLRYRLLDEAGFRDLVPQDVIARLTRTPPRLFVMDGDTTLVDALPELRAALGRGSYRLVGKWSPLRIYLRQ